MKSLNFGSVIAGGMQFAAYGLRGLAVSAWTKVANYRHALAETGAPRWLRLALVIWAALDFFAPGCVLSWTLFFVFHLFFGPATAWTAAGIMYVLPVGYAEAFTLLKVAPRILARIYGV